MTTNEDLEKRIAALEAQVATHHSIIRDLAENGKKFYASLTALQQAFDTLLQGIDPNYHSPQPPPSKELM